MSSDVMSQEAATSTRPEPATSPTASRIVVGVDGSEPSKSALAWAARQAALTGASLEVIGAWGYPAYYGQVGSWSIDFDPEKLTRDELQQVTHDVIGSSSPVAAHLHVRHGLPTEVLLHEAEGADLLVLGCRGHNELAGLLLGSVSQHCAAHASCPVVVVHDHGAARSETRSRETQAREAHARKAQG